MKKCYNINSCQICKSKKINKILELGFIPSVNDYRKVSSNNEFFNTEIYLCQKCKLFQLGTIVDRKILFPKNYPYKSSATGILRRNFLELSNEVQKKRLISKKDLVIDIGSNDGNLLSFFKNKCKVLGITPEEVGKDAIKKGIPTIIDYFDKKTVAKVIKKYGRCKILTATNVFAHIDNINEILTEVKKILLPEGIFIIEFHYLIDLIKTNQFDTIYHEHMRYYSLSSIKYLLDKQGFKIFDCKKIKTHGGSLRIWCSRKKFSRSEKFKKMHQSENVFFKKLKINSLQKKVNDSKNSFYRLIKKHKISTNLIGVGAPSRGTTLINFFGLKGDMIKNIIEIPTSKKINKFMPGTNILIISEDNLKTKKNDFLILSWHIKEEIIKNLKKKGFKGRFIVPLPKPKIYY